MKIYSAQNCNTQTQEMMEVTCYTHATMSNKHLCTCHASIRWRTLATVPPSSH